LRFPSSAKAIPTLPADGGGLYRGVVEAIDQAAGTADVRLNAGPQSLVTGAPISEAVPMELVHVGDDVLVLLWDDGGAVVLGPFGASGAATPHSWPIHGRDATTTNQTVSSTGYVALSGGSATIALRETCYLWLWGQLALSHDTVRTSAGRVALFVDGGSVMPVARFGMPVADTVLNVTLAQRTPGAYAPGNHTVDLRAKVDYGADTTTVYSVALSALALPD